VKTFQQIKKDLEKTKQQLYLGQLPARPPLPRRRSFVFILPNLPLQPLAIELQRLPPLPPAFNNPWPLWSRNPRKQG